MTHLSRDYLLRCKEMTPDEILEYLDQYRLTVNPKQEKCKLISLKIEPSLLKAFKAKSKLSNVPYQSQIKQLMKDWLENSS